MLAALIAGTATAQEQIAPLAADQVVMIVSPSGPGSSIDAMARTYAAIAGRYTTQKFVFDNQAGAAGFIATNYVLEQPANGYTLQAFTQAATLNFLTQTHTEANRKFKLLFSLSATLSPARQAVNRAVFC